MRIQLFLRVLDKAASTWWVAVTVSVLQRQFQKGCRQIEEVCLSWHGAREQYLMRLDHDACEIFHELAGNGNLLRPDPCMQAPKR